MTTQNINDKLKGAATLWQLIFSVVSVVVVVLAFAFSLRADFVTASASMLTLVLSEVGGTQAWREKSRRSY